MAQFIHPVFNKTKDIPDSKLNNLVRQVDTEVFSKTDCLACGNCCKSAPPIVTKKDIKRIAKYLNITAKQFERRFVIQDINGELSFDRIPCNFLGEDNYCSIYEVRPNACKDFPHIQSGQFNKRKKLHSINSQMCPAASEILNTIEEKINTLQQ